MNDRITTAEVLFTGFLLEHNIPLATMLDFYSKKCSQTPKLPRAMHLLPQQMSHIIQRAITLQEFESVPSVIEGHD